MFKHHEMVGTRCGFGCKVCNGFQKVEKPFVYVAAEKYALLDNTSFEAFYDERLTRLAKV